MTTDLDLFLGEEFPPGIVAHLTPLACHGCSVAQPVGECSECGNSLCRECFAAEHQTGCEG